MDDNNVSVQGCNTVTTSAPSATLVTSGSAVNDVATVTGNLVNGTPTGTVLTL